MTFRSLRPVLPTFLPCCTACVCGSSDVAATLGFLLAGVEARYDTNSYRFSTKGLHQLGFPRHSGDNSNRLTLKWSFRRGTYFGQLGTSHFGATSIAHLSCI